MKEWSIPLLGCIPDRPYLGHPALADLERLFKTHLVSGQRHRFRHYTVDDINLVTTSLTTFLHNLREKNSRTLYICHVTRDDIILGFLGEHQRRQRKGGAAFESALFVCGRKDKYSLSTELMDMIKAQGDEVPIMMIEMTTHAGKLCASCFHDRLTISYKNCISHFKLVYFLVMDKIHKFTPKLNNDDSHRLIAAVEHYEPYINYDLLLSRTGNLALSDALPNA